MKTIMKKIQTGAQWSRYCLRSLFVTFLLMLTFGIGQAWGEDISYTTVKTESWAQYGDAFYETNAFANTTGIDQISYTYNSISGGEGIIAEYSVDGTNFAEFNTKPAANNGVVTDAIPAGHPARNAVKLRFKAKGAYGWHAIWGLSIRKATSSTDIFPYCVTKEWKIVTDQYLPINNVISGNYDYTDANGVRFVLDIKKENGDDVSIENKKTYLKFACDKNSHKRAKLTWSGTGNYSIQVTKVTVQARNDGGGTSRCVVGGVVQDIDSEVKINESSSREVSKTKSEGFSNDLLIDFYRNGSGVITGSNYIEQIIVSYKLIYNAKVFGFEANRVINNSSYGSATVTVKDTIHGAAGQTSASTTAAYSATPNDGCQFIGWYTDSEYSDELSKSKTYDSVLTNTIPGSIVTSTLYAKFAGKTPQTITWNQTIGNKIRSNEFDITDISASSGLGITYTASPEGRVSIVGTHVICLTAGEVTITASQAGNSVYFPATNVSKTFSIVEHAITTLPTASGIIYKQTLASSMLSGGVATVSGTWSWDDNSVAPGVGTASHVAVFTPNNASGAFTASDTLHCLVDVTVSRMPTTIEYIGADSYAVNAANIPATSLFQVRGSNGELLASPAITLETSDDSKIAIVGGNTADFLCGGSATITASYAGDANYLASNLGRSITVNQLSDAIVWNNVRAEDNKIHVWADTVLTATMASANTGITYTIEGGTNVSVEGSTYTITTPGEVTLRATSAGSCTYASVTDTKQVVVDHCRHFLVWDQDFAALPPDDEEGHIDFSEALTAYAVDSTGEATGVTVNYSMPSVDFAHIEDGVLYVTGTGSTTITATTVSDDKFAVVSKTIAVNVLAPGDLGATVGKSTLIDNFNDEAKSVSWTSGHVTFTLSGNGLYTDKWVGSKYFYLYARSSTYTYELTWTVNDKDVNGNSAYIINVKKLTLDVDRASGLGTYVTIAGNRSGNIYDSGNIPAGGLSSGDLNLGEDGKITITVETSDLFYSNIAVNNINVLYTLLPVINTENQSVDVTVCDDNKQLLDLSECASLADRSAHAALSYRVISDNASDAHITADKKFYANSVGSYTVRAAVPQTVCHNPNTAEFTITVTPAALSLSPTASDITYRQALSASTLTGTATVGGCAVAGTWAWSAPTTVPYVGEDQPFAVVFTPSSDADNYSGFTTTALVDVKRAQFIFDGSGDDEENKENWAIVDNWQSNADPGEEDVAIIRHDVIIAAEVAVYSLKIEGESKVTVAPTGGLTVGAGGIIDATKDNLKLQAGTSGVEKGQTGYLRISPDYAGAMPEATVELFSVSYYDQAAGADNSAVWQGVGSPISEAGVLAKSVYTSCWVYSWNEATDGWVNNRATLELTPFVGFSTTQKKEPEGRKYTYEGHLVSGVAPVTMDLAYTEGHGTNLLANSWAAPISIPNFESSDFVNAAQTIYILNAGTKAQSDANEGEFTAPGKYIGVPVLTASELAASGYPVVIPSMQGFWVQAERASAQLRLNYSRLVWGADYSGDGSNQPLRAPKHNAEASPVTGKMKVSISAGGWSDFIFLLESEKYLPEYEDGYDAIKIPSGGMDLFTVEGENYLGVDATNSIIGTRVGVRTSEETAYTMTFSHMKSESDMSLWDLEADQKIEINEGTTYTFFAEPNAEITDRFLIIERAGASTNTTGVDDAEDEANVHKFIKDNQLYILKNGVLYNGTGARVK